MTLGNMRASSLDRRLSLTETGSTIHPANPAPVLHERRVRKGYWEESVMAAFRSGLEILGVSQALETKSQ
jgi:hypothetical protein